MLHGLVKLWRKTETDSHFVKTLLDSRNRSLDIDTQFSQHVGRSRLASDTAIAVLGNGHTRRGRNQGRGRTDIESARGITPRATGVNELSSIRSNGGHMPSHSLGGASHFRDGFALLSQRIEK